MKQALDRLLEWNFDLFLEFLFLAFDRQISLHFLHSDRLFQLSLLVVDVKRVVYDDGQSLLNLL